MKKFGKWFFNNVLLNPWVPMGAGCALTIICAISDEWVGAVIGFVLCLFPTGLQALGYKPME